MTRLATVDGSVYQVLTTPTAGPGRSPSAITTVSGPSIDTTGVTIRAIDETRREVVAEDGSWRHIVEIVRDGDRHWVFCDGQVFEIGCGQRSGPVPDATDRGLLEAPMPATVSRVLVRPGDIVKYGDTLVLLEAMKMELPLRAPADGRITSVRCQPGDLVQPGSPLVDLADLPD